MDSGASQTSARVRDCGESQDTDQWKGLEIESPNTSHSGQLGPEVRDCGFHFLLSVGFENQCKE